MSPGHVRFTTRSNRLAHASRPAVWWDQIRRCILMGMSKAKKARLKQERAGELNPEIVRGQWHRKPQTQVVLNKKADQRRTQCRHTGSRDGADSLL